MKSTLASRLKARRIQLGLSQTDLAEIAGIRSSSIHNYEAGLRDKPRNLLQLAEALKVAPQWLETGDPAFSPEKTSVTQKPQISIPLLQWSEVANWKSTIDNRIHGLGDQALITVEAHQYTFALKIIDNALSAMFSVGSIVVCEPSEQPVNGKYVIVVNGELATIKKYLVDDGVIYLEPMDNRFPTKPMSADTQICGVIKQITYNP